MIVSIHRTTAYAYHLVTDCQAGTVHSVYGKTINILLNGKLLALQAADSPLSPISLMTGLSQQEMAALSIAAGMAVSIQKKPLHIHIGADSFSLEQADVIALSLAPISQPKKLIPLLQAVISRSNTHGLRGIFCPEAISNRLDERLIVNAAKEHLRHCTEHILISNYTTAAGFLSRLIGLGIGLTPSGDDFLCGVLAGLTLCDLTAHPFAQAVSAVILHHLQDTNDISQAFLQCALNGQFSEAICRLSAVSDPNHIADTFHAIGHSSGIDSLCGILYMLTLPIP